MARVAMLLLALVLLVGCGATTAAQPEPPTPTPLPPDPALERPTYTVKRGAIERVLEITARVTPVDLVRLAFRRDGRMNKVFFQVGDMVRAGDVLAELQQDDALDELRQAQDTLVQARRDLENAQKAQAKDIREKELAVEQATEDLNMLLPGGEKDVVLAAQKKLEEAQRAAKTTGDTASWNKTSAEEGLRDATEALQDSQKAFAKASWDWDWVQKYGTHPTERVPSTKDPDVLVPRKLNDAEKDAFKEAVATAERSLRDAERSLEGAQRAFDKAREDEVVENQKSGDDVQQAQRELDKLLNGGSRETQAARRVLDQANLALEEARQKSFNAELKLVETAQRSLEKAQKKVDDGRVIAPQDGQVLVISAEEGAMIMAFEPLVEVADPSRLEFAATLNPDQMRQLSEGQPAEIRLLTRPDLALPAIIRRMPAPYGSGGSGSVQDRDQTTRFQVEDTRGQELQAGTTIGKISVTLERKEGVLWLPPDAVRSFEGRRFVVVRTGERERRVTVRVGIETEEQLEILEGLNQGDLVVGQ